MKRAILTCVYDRLDHFGRCIESVVNNTEFRRFDYYIVVDYNPNTSFVKGLSRIKKRYAEHLNIFWIYRDSNLGGRENWTLAWEELVDNYDFVLNIEDDIILSKIALEYCIYVEQIIDDSTLGFCLWRDERWVDLFPSDCYFKSYEFSGWGWYSKGIYIRKFLEMENDNLWVQAWKPVSLIEYIHYYKVVNNNFYWGDRLKSLYNRIYNKSFIHSSVSLAENIGLDGSGMHSGSIHIPQKKLASLFVPLSEVHLRDSDLVRRKYREDKKFSSIGSLYFKAWYFLKKLS